MVCTVIGCKVCKSSSHFCKKCGTWDATHFSRCCGKGHVCGTGKCAPPCSVKGCKTCKGNEPHPRQSDGNKNPHPSQYFKEEKSYAKEEKSDFKPSYSDLTSRDKRILNALHNDDDLFSLNGSKKKSSDTTIHPGNMRGLRFDESAAIKAAGVIFVDRSTRVVRLLLQKKPTGEYCLVGGRSEGETPYRTAYRECEEETGCRPGGKILFILEKKRLPKFHSFTYVVESQKTSWVNRGSTIHEVCENLDGIGTEATRGHIWVTEDEFHQLCSAKLMKGAHIKDVQRIFNELK